MRKKRVFKRKMRRTLVKKGYQLLKTDENKNAMGFMVCVFQDTTDLNSNLSKFKC